MVESSSTARLMDEIIDYNRHFGLWRTLGRAAYVTVNRVARLKILDCLVMTTDHVSADTFDPASRFESRFLESEEALALSRLPESGLQPDVTRVSLDNGDRCFGIFDGDRLASYGWYAAQSTVFYGDWTVDFDSNYKFMYGGFTSTDYRGLRLHALGIVRALADVSASGASGLLSTCERTNYRAWVSVVRMGWRRSGTVYRWDLPGRGFCRTTADCRPFALSFGVADDTRGSN